jgi:hypothetical protein
LIETKPSFSPLISFLLDDPTVQQLSDRSGFPAAYSELSRDWLKQVAD